MINTLVKRWLHRQACAEHEKAQADLDEIQRMHDLYAARNRGEDGYEPGIWYQEQELAPLLVEQRTEVEFLRSVVDELSEHKLLCTHPVKDENMVCDACRKKGLS